MSEELRQLADSVRVRGLLQPLIVYEQSGRFVTVDGHRRLEAASIAGIDEVLALVLSSKPDVETLLLVQLAANSLRVDLKPSEKALPTSTLWICGAGRCLNWQKRYMSANRPSRN